MLVLTSHPFARVLILAALASLLLDCSEGNDALPIDESDPLLTPGACDPDDTGTDTCCTDCQDETLYVDVRTPEEYGEQHYPGAINIPVDDIVARQAELYPRDQSITLYCRSGNRSNQALLLLEAEGFTDITDAGALTELLETL